MLLDGSVVKDEHLIETSSGNTIYAVEKRPTYPSPRGAVLLIHGVGVGYECWDVNADGYSLMEILAREGFDVFAVNQRGYGRSSKVNGLTVRTGECAGDMESVIDYVGQLRGLSKLDVVGHSFGGMVAKCLAANRPERIRKLVVMGSPHRVVRSEFRPVVDELAGLAHQGVPYAPNLHHLTAHQSLHSYEPEVLNLYKNLVGQWYPEWPTGVFLDLESIPFVDCVRSITAPTLLINGVLDRVVDPLDAVQCLNDLRADVKALLLMGNVGHLVWLEKNAHRDIYQAIVSWLG